ncbi:MAG: cysteine--tRNA ligase [Actinomycetota bacterium]
MLNLYDTSARSKRPFEPLNEGQVSMYVCGPTVYDEAHLGHARSAIAFDVIRRVLEAFGYQVRFVRNITDVDDKILNRAMERGELPEEIAERYARSYAQVLTRLGVKTPSLEPKATQHIADMQALIQSLLDSGAAYAVDGGDVYFRVDRHEQYGEISGRSLEEMRAGERVEPDPRKQHPMDFALWKGAKPGEVSWDAPWGAGRPGWHIECSAMSMRYLGETFDIHGGGADLVFPHHENEAAQSRALTGKPLANYWLHNGFVTLDAEKMSKSLHNYILVDQVLARYPAPAIRLLFVATHYRSQLEVNEATIGEAVEVWDKMATMARNAVRALGDESPKPISSGGRLDAFMKALSDDINTPAAMAEIHSMIAEANQLIDAVEKGEDPQALADSVGRFRAATAILGLDPIGDWPTDGAHAAVAPLVEYLLADRARARTDKDFARADQIRDALIAAGVIVEDRPNGARWHLASPWL